MSAQHTPGQLVVARDDEDWRAPCREDSKTSVAATIKGGNGEVVALAVVCFDGWTNRAKVAELDANARRLVACWNACDGVPTEALEAAGTLVVTTKPEPT